MQAIALNKPNKIERLWELSESMSGKIPPMEPATQQKTASDGVTCWLLKKSVLSKPLPMVENCRWVLKLAMAFSVINNRSASTTIDRQRPYGYSRIPPFYTGVLLQQKLRYFARFKFVKYTQLIEKILWRLQHLKVHQ